MRAAGDSVTAATEKQSATRAAAANPLPDVATASCGEEETMRTERESLQPFFS